MILSFFFENENAREELLSALHEAVMRFLSAGIPDAIHDAVRGKEQRQIIHAIDSGITSALEAGLDQAEFQICCGGK